MSFPAYETYHETGDTLFGDVPAHWHVTRLGFLCCKVGSGKTPKGGSETYFDEGVLFIRSQNVYDEGLQLEDVVYISEEVDEEMAISRVEPGDIVLNITGASLGRTCLVPADIPAANVNQHVCIIRLKDASQREFVSLAMKAILIKSQIDSCQNGAAREGLNFVQVGRLRLALPPLPEQRASASFLDRETSKIDSLVSEQRRLVELLKEKRQAVISHAVTKGLDPTVPMKPSGIEWLGDVPEHWEVGKVKHYLSTCSGGTPNTAQQSLYYAEEGSGHPWVRTTDLNNDFVTEVPIHITDQALIDTACSILPAGTVMVAMYGGDGTVGKNGLLMFKAAINQAVCGLLPSESHDSQFIFRFMQFYRPYWMIGAESSRKDPNISQERVKNAPCLRPPLNEQRDIVAFVNARAGKYDSLIAEANRAIALLQERRTALISAAVTGKIDVRATACEGANR
jgi:type I restriction enzyme S subunit